MKNLSELEKMRHSTAHLLASAVLELWPETKLAIGPAIENGFYYDFDFDKPISEDDLPKIEKEMAEIVKSWKKFERMEVTKAEALRKFSGNSYKKELIEEFSKENKTLTLYKSGEFTDLCKGVHTDNPNKEIKYFKLLSTAGAYWRGSEKNPMLTRIYGTVWPSKKELDDYLLQLEEAKKRDHKKLGIALELFFFHPTSPGMAYWLPKGVVLYNTLVEFWRREHLKHGYQETMSPMLNKKGLYVVSGHFDHYWQDMFVANMGENEEYGIKAMNCPNAMTIFAFKSRSYKELPLRLSDTDPLHRYELSGVLNGLFRVREFRQDDAHIFVTEEQIEKEFENLFKLVERFYSIFDLEYSFRLGTRPENFLGEKKTWDQAEAVLTKILEKSGKPFITEAGEGAFYGPKIDILMKDSLGRKWQMGTLQLDFQQPARFKLKYSDSEGKEKTPIAIHRAIYGSLERFIGILIEHYAGKLPTFISPVQAEIIPITDRNTVYAETVKKQLNELGFRAEVNSKTEPMGAKIRDAQLQKIPYMLVVGDREQVKKEVAVRDREGKNLGTISLETFVNHMRKELPSDR